MLSFGTSWNPIRFTFCWCYAVQQRSRSSAICALSNKEPQELRRDPITRWTSQPSWWKLFGSLKALQGIELDLYNNWLVVYLPLWKNDGVSSSVGMIIHSQLNGKNIQLCSKQTTLNYQAVSWRARDNQEIRVDFGNVVQDPNGIAAQCLQHHLSDTNPIVGQWSIWWAFNHQRRDVDQPILGRSNAKPL